VAVDEARDNESSLSVDALVVSILVREGICETNPRDVGPAPGKRGPRDCVNPALTSFVATGGEKADVNEDRHDCSDYFPSS
jgi:hypothetical protein